MHDLYILCAYHFQDITIYWSKISVNVVVESIPVSFEYLARVFIFDL